VAQLSTLGIVRAMNHLGLYFAGVLVVLLAFSISLVFVARATKWKPKPIKPVWVALAVFGAAFVAGSVCAIFGRDIHILYWWLIGAPVAAVLIPLIVVITNLVLRLLMRVLFLLFQKR
jgi:hypothetical protein